MKCPFKQKENIERGSYVMSLKRETGMKKRQDVNSAPAGTRASHPTFPAPDTSSGPHNEKNWPGSVDHAACMQPRTQESAPPKPQG